MLKFGEKVVKYRVVIIIIALLLLIPSCFGMANTRINYDMLDYLPESMDTVKGQGILLDDFGKGAFSILVVEGMDENGMSNLRKDVEKVEHVDSVISYDKLAGNIPIEVLPQKYYDAFNKGDARLMAVFFDTSTSADDTLNAIEEVRDVAGKDCFVTGMSAMVTDLKKLCEKEEPIYVGLAVVLAALAMTILLDSFVLPLLFLSSIGMAILWNLGSNIFLGEISYITKALSAVLQLGVTMDYSIFLWHSYKEEKENYADNKDAMAHAIANTIVSVTGSSITTVAGFIALCFMSFTLGKDLGIVMAKGVIFGVIGCVTTLPSLILLFDKFIEKTTHKSLIPNMDGLAEKITKYSAVFIAIFLIVVGPAFYGYQKANVYYDIGGSMPKDMDYMVANNKLDEDFNMGCTHMILFDSKMDQNKASEMVSEIEEVKGVKGVMGLPKIIGPMVPEEFLPKEALEILKSDKHELMMVSSEYKVASDEVNNQIGKINDILKSYDKDGMLIGEAPCTKDLIEVTDHDFMVVSWLSVLAIFIIIAIVFKSVSLPFILVAVIEFAIFINLGIPYYTGTVMPFVAPICISTIQLGATVDYAILMTTRYKKERNLGLDKKEAIKVSLSTSIPAIMTSALGFFAATFGVGLYSEIDIIGSMCNLMARGAIISMFACIFVLPSLLTLFDRVICKTSHRFIENSENIA